VADGDPIAFTRVAAERIANAVRTVELGSRDPGGIEFDAQQDQRFRLRLGTFTGNWQTGEWKTVTLSGSTNTASVYNWCNPAIGASTSNTNCSRYVIFGSVRGTSSAVEIQLQQTCSTCRMSLGSLDLASLPGFVSGEIQMLGHNSTGPCLQWYSVANCGTATSS
jgi:hypothetical protein